jgi:hypothetical protein
MLPSVSFNTLHDGSCSISFRIPWTKTTCEEGASVIATAWKDLLCPYAAMSNHLDINHDAPYSMSLFAHSSTISGKWEYLTKYKFINFCIGVWSNAALAHVLGHSFRIGGAVELLLAGVPPEIIAATGGWTSLAFLLYWRQMEEILPMSASKAYWRSHVDDLVKLFEQLHVDQRIPSNLLSAPDNILEL